MTTNYYSLASGSFTQDWTNAGLITANDDWSGVPYIVGYLGQDITTATGADPRTIADRPALSSTSTSSPTRPIRTRSPPAASPNSYDRQPDRRPAGLGHRRRALPRPLHGRERPHRHQAAGQSARHRRQRRQCGPADQRPVPHRAQRPLDQRPRAAISPTSPPAAARPRSPRSTSPCRPAPTMRRRSQIRIMTTNAVGSDEWVGIDDIVVSSQVEPDHRASRSTTRPCSRAMRAPPRSASPSPASAEQQRRRLGPLRGRTCRAARPAPARPISAAPRAQRRPQFRRQRDSRRRSPSRSPATSSTRPNETFTVTLSAPTNGATLADGIATGTIVNDDAFVSGGRAVHQRDSITTMSAATAARRSRSPARRAPTSPAGRSSSTTAMAARSYDTKLLSGIVPNQDDGYGTLTFACAVNGVQNGSPDGFALVDPQRPCRPVPVLRRGDDRAPTARRRA